MLPMPDLPNIENKRMHSSIETPDTENMRMHSSIESPDRKNIEVVAAVIFDAQGRVFATQRGYGEWKDWWEFPGGKIEPRESMQEALMRELREELDAEIEVHDLLCTVRYDYPRFHLTMHCFRCTLAGNRFTLLEHEAAKWLEADALHSVKWLPADMQIIDNIVSSTQAGASTSVASAAQE